MSKEALTMVDIQKALYSAIKLTLKNQGYQIMSISRARFEPWRWRFIFMDDGSCPFTLDYFYLVEVGKGITFKVDFLTIGGLTPYELSKVPAERMEVIKHIDEICKKGKEVA